MILQNHIADVIIGVIAVLLVALFIFTVFRKRKNGCGKCSGCAFEGKCGGNCGEHKNNEKNSDK